MKLGAFQYWIAVIAFARPIGIQKVAYCDLLLICSDVNGVSSPRHKTPCRQNSHAEQFDTHSLLLTS